MPRNHRKLLTRRRFLQSGATGIAGAAALPLVAPRASSASVTPGVLPTELLAIGHEPQFVFDLHTVDCTWGIQEKKEPVKRVFHGCRKHGDKPLLTGDQPSHFWVARDADTGLFRMWYQLNH